MREGVPEEAILVTGNPVIDALQHAIQLPYDVTTGPLAGINWDKRIVLVTAYRRESFGVPLEAICRALVSIVKQYQGDVQVVYPVHPNSNVRETVHRLLGGDR